MIDELTFAFLAGTVATANPCGFALLPAFLARQLEHTAPGRPQAIARALLVGALTTAGFLVVFATVGSAFSLGARSLTRVLPWAALVIGATFILAGLAVLAGKRVAIPAALPLRPRSGRGLGTPFLFGLGYGTASLSCTLPIFLAVVGTAITAQPTTGILAFAAYAAGMGTILTALSLAVALSHAGLAARIRRLQPHMRLINGLTLTAAGAYIVYYWGYFLLPDTVGQASPAPIRFVDRLVSTLQTWLSTALGQAITVTLAALLLLIIATITWRARSTITARAAATLRLLMRARPRRRPTPRTPASRQPPPTGLSRSR